MNAFGFSLLELLIVITISSILALIGIGSWRDLQARSELAAITRGLVQFLNEVKADANFYNYNQSIYMIKSGQQGWCIAVSQNSKPIDCQTTFRFIPNYSTIELMDSTSDAMFIFYGRRSTAKAATITLKNSIGESRIIISVPGRIRYCSYKTYLAGFHSC